MADMDYNFCRETPGKQTTKCYDYGSKGCLKTCYYAKTRIVEENKGLAEKVNNLSASLAQ